MAEVSVSDQWVESLAAETSGDYAEALKIHRQLLPSAEPSYLAYLRAGWLYYKTENYSDSLKYYKKAAGLSSGALSPLYGVLNCYVAQGKTDDAIKVAKAILVVDPQNYTANLQMASIYYQQKSFLLASTRYQKLNRFYPEDLAVASGLAWSYLEQGERQKALPLFNEILMVSPDYAYAQQGQSLCTSATGRSGNQQSENQRSENQRSGGKR
jgi:tetratricopeptide (TPR) repeat protein